MLWRTVLDDIVLLAPEANQPVALAGGALLWGLLERPVTTDELALAMRSATASPSPGLEVSLARFLDELAGIGVLEGLPA